MANVIGQLIGQVIGGAIAALIIALIIQSGLQRKSQNSNLRMVWPIKVHSLARSPVLFLGL